jgi:hypothetical protein
MTFDDLLAQILTLLQQQGRVSYGALKRRFGLDDAYLARIIHQPKNRSEKICLEPN